MADGRWPEPFYGTVQPFCQKKVLPLALGRRDRQGAVRGPVVGRRPAHATAQDGKNGGLKF